MENEKVRNVEPGVKNQDGTVWATISENIIGVLPWSLEPEERVLKVKDWIRTKRLKLRYSERTVNPNFYGTIKAPVDAPVDAPAGPGLNTMIGFSSRKRD